MLCGTSNVLSSTLSGTPYASSADRTCTPDVGRGAWWLGLRLAWSTPGSGVHRQSAWCRLGSKMSGGCSTVCVCARARAWEGVQHQQDVVENKMRHDTPE